MSFNPDLLLLSKHPRKYAPPWWALEPWQTHLGSSTLWTLLPVPWGLQRTSSSWCWWSRVNQAVALPDPSASTASFELRANPGDGSTLFSDLPFSALTTPPMAGTTLLMLLFSLAECTWTMRQLAMNMQSLLLLLLKPGLCAKLLSVSCAPPHACTLTVTQWHFSAVHHSLWISTIPARAMATLGSFDGGNGRNLSSSNKKEQDIPG